MLRARSRCRGSAKIWIKIRVVEVLLLLEVSVVIKESILLGHSRPGDFLNISNLFAVEVTHTPLSVCSKDDVPENIITMSVTLETSHLERSPLNDDAE